MPVRSSFEKRAQRLLAAWSRKWGTPGLLRVRIEWSDRLTTSLGRALPARRLVRLASVLRRRPRLLEHVLCHELAHVAAYERKRRREGPHGATWATLVRSAGFDPVLRVAMRTRATTTRRAPSDVRWIHRCPVCQFRRVARRPVAAWRCAACVEAGLAGELVVTRRAAAAA